MKIKWLGHASFMVESQDGTRIITDPFEAGSYDGAVGYDPIQDRADVVTISHDHADLHPLTCRRGNRRGCQFSGGSVRLAPEGQVLAAKPKDIASDVAGAIADLQVPIAGAPCPEGKR